MPSLIFDLDGTLIDSAPSILASFKAALDAHGIAPVVPLTSDIIGPPLMQTLALISGHTDEATLAQLAASFKSFYDTEGYQDTVVYDGVAAALAKLHEAGVPMYIVTNKRIHPTRQIMAHLGWTPYFNGVYAQDAFEPAKASKAEVIAAVLSHHGIDPAKAWYVGDHHADGVAAQRNGVPFAWVTWGYGVAVDLSAFDGSVAIHEPRGWVALASPNQ